MEKINFYLINASIVPDIYKKVIKAKSLLASGEAKSASQAAKMADISRSAYYKYKDDVFPMGQDMQSKKVTLIILMTHKSGTLSKVLDCIAFYKGNILTINQDIPINLSANVTVTIDISHMEKSISQLAARLNSLPNVRSVKLLAAE